MASSIIGWRRSYAVLFSATVLAVAVADFFFYGHKIGWTAAGFAALLVILITLRSARFFRTWGGKIIAVATIGLLVALIDQPTWLNVPYMILCVAALSITNSFGLPKGFPEWNQRLGRLITTGWMRLFSDNSIVIRCMVRYGVSPRGARVILAWILPVILASVFLALFAWGNPILANWLSSLGAWVETLLEKIPNLLNFARMAFWLAFAIFSWTLLRGRGMRRRRKQDPLIDTPLQPAPAQISYGPIITLGLVVRCLILFNLVFLVENVLDVRFLGNKSLLLPTGIEYKEYVRRGAYPLIAAALLAGLFVLVTFRPGSRTERSRAARALVYAWIAQTIFLTATAAWRLEQYVEMSELTRLRVASVVWFFLVGMGLFYIIWRILFARTNLWLINVNALTAAVVIYGCCFINFDQMIARFNIQHCREGGGIGSSLDIEYFRDLGPTVLPEFEAIHPKIDIGWRRDQAAKVAADLHRELAEERGDWRAWTLRKAHAQEAVDAQLAASAKAVVDANQTAPAAAPSRG